MVLARSCCLVLVILSLPSLVRDAHADGFEHQQADLIAMCDSERWSDALKVADKIVQQFPDRPDGYFLRSGIEVALAGRAGSPAALARPDRGFDYVAARRHLGAAAQDLRKYLEHAPDAPDRAGVLAAISTLEERAKAAATATNEFIRKDGEVRARNRDAELSITRAAEDERLEIERIREFDQLSEARRREGEKGSRRKRGYALLGTGIGLGGIAAAFLGLSASVRSDIDAGGFSTPAQIVDQFNKGEAFTGCAIGLGIAAAVLTTAGIAVVASNRPARVGKNGAE
jgi:hypothetical protein